MLQLKRLNLRRKHKKDLTEAVLVVEEIKKEQKIYFKSSVESIIKIVRAIKLFHGVEKAELKETVTEENNISVHEAEISVAVIPVEEIKEEAKSKSRKCKRE